MDVDLISFNIIYYDFSILSKTKFNITIVCCVKERKRQYFGFGKLIRVVEIVVNFLSSFVM